MSDDTETMVDYEYEDQFSYLTGGGDLMLKETALFGERKIADVEKDDAVSDIVEERKQAFKQLEEKVSAFIQMDDKKKETIEELKNELKEAPAIGDYEALLTQLNKAEEVLESGSNSETDTDTEAGNGEEVGDDTTAENKEETVDAETAAPPDTEADAAAAAGSEAVKEEETVVEQESGSDTGADDQSAGETEAIEESAEETEAETAEAEVEEEEETEGVGYYKELADRAEELSKQSDWPYVSMELENLQNRWDEGPDLVEDDQEVKELLGRFQEAVDSFQNRKKEHYEELNRQKRENLEKKKELVEQLDEIVTGENWTAVKKVNSIKGRFRNIGILPSDEGDDLDDRFKALLAEFEEHKVDRLVSKRQQEEDNLTGKLIVLDKMAQLVSSIDDQVEDWKALDKEFDRLTRQFKKIGRVPPEKSDEVWARFKSSQEAYYDQKYKSDDTFRREFDKFYQKKEDLCKKAEALLDQEDLAGAARELNRLHRKWKKTGNLPQKDEDELWGRFKAATDAFNNRKSENIDKLRKQEEENEKKKLELIERAKEINDTNEWDKGHSKMQSLLDRWKKVGPVPRNKSRKLWKQFKKAQDVFYDRRREHFKERKEEQKENLKQKEEILDKLRELGKHEDPIQAVEQAKPLQEEFKNAGYVPIKKKNKIWKDYREACDVIYERFRAAKSGNKFDQELAKADLDPENRSKIMEMRKQYKKVKHEMHKLEEEVLQFKESKTYFKSSQDDNPLLNEIEAKIEKAENKLEKKNDKLDSLEQKIDELRSGS